MNRLHIAAVAALLALAAVLGTFAATRTAGLGAASHQVTRTTQLSAFEAKLRRELAAAKRGQTPPARVVFHRPPPVVTVLHTHHSDDEGESEGQDD
jgi:hypothetical protein